MYRKAIQSKFTTSASNMSADILNIKKGDIAVVLAVVLLAAMLFAAFRPGGDTAVVTQNGRQIYSFHLNDAALDGTSYTVDGKYHNVITIRDGQIFVSDADCPDRTCVHSAPIGRHGGSIVCAPNALIIRVGTHDSWDVISR